MINPGTSWILCCFVTGPSAVSFGNAISYIYIYIYIILCLLVWADVIVVSTGHSRGPHGNVGPTTFSYKSLNVFSSPDHSKHPPQKNKA